MADTAIETSFAQRLGSKRQNPPQFLFSCVDTMRNMINEGQPYWGVRVIGDLYWTGVCPLNTKYLELKFPAQYTISFGVPLPLPYDEPVEVTKAFCVQDKTTTKAKLRAHLTVSPLSLQQLILGLC